MAKQHLTALWIVRKNGTTDTYISNDSAPDLQHKNPARGIARLEKNILMGTESTKWEIAYLYDATQPKGSAPLHAYHFTKDTEQLTKADAEYLRVIHQAGKGRGKYRAWVIPSREAQEEGEKCRAEFIEEIEDGIQLIRGNVVKVMVYDDHNIMVRAFHASLIERQIAAIL